MANNQTATTKPLEYDLRKYLLLLATIVATVTYGVAFDPPGGVWHDTSDGRLAGDSIIRDTHYPRYIMFFFCNATAFVLSIVVIIFIFILALPHKEGISRISNIIPLRAAMVLDLLALIGAYAAGTNRGVLSVANVSALVAVFIYMVAQIVVTSMPEKKQNQNQNTSTGDDRVDEEEETRRRKIFILLATFVASITYVGGLSVPGRYWESNKEGHQAGDPVLWEHHTRRLRAFYVCNTIAFVASLLIIMLLLDKKQRIFYPLVKTKIIVVRTSLLYVYIVIALFGIVGAYVAGTCREPHTTIYVLSLVFAVLLCIGALKAVISFLSRHPSLPQRPLNNSSGENKSSKADILDKAQSLVILLATLVVTVTYQAGLVPPGGVWQKNEDGHMAGEPVLLSMQAKRYKAFFYCNSTAFAVSLVVIILVPFKHLHSCHILEIAMMLDLFGLMGAYAAGSCRDIATSIYIIALAGAVLIYVVIHVVFFTLEDNVKDNKGENKNENAGNLDEQNLAKNHTALPTQDASTGYNNHVQNDSSINKRRKRLLLFAVLGATLTYQAGLTPPGGFRLEDDEFGHHAGDPILFSSFPRRYKAFFYCNSISFMLSIALIILLVNRNLYRPAIQSYALSVCTATGTFVILGAYAAGSTQHFKTSIYVFVLAALVLFIMVILLVCFYRSEGEENQDGVAANSPKKDDKAKRHAKRKYLMLLGVLAASVTYQAGLNPPGGVWQGNGEGHAAGHQVMYDNKRHRYQTFFYSNSTSFVASIVVIILLLLKGTLENNMWLIVMNIAIVLDLLGLLLAYVAGSSMRWETAGYVIVIVVTTLCFAGIYKFLSFITRSKEQKQGDGQR